MTTQFKATQGSSRNHRDLRDEPDKTMNAILEELTTLLNAVASEGANNFTIQWLNVREKLTNPDGDSGFVRLVARRQAN